MPQTKAKKKTAPEKLTGWRRFVFAYREIPNKKPYIEFFTAVLSIPVLLTVILLNVNSLRQDKKATTPTPQPEKIFVTVADSGKTVTTSTGPCKAGLGDISIDSPDENDVVTDNPVTMDINYEQGSYCEAVWSYRVNGGKWSDYDDKSVALYNLPQGKIKFELRVKSVVNSATRNLTRSFVYQGDSDQKVGSSSAN